MTDMTNPPAKWDAATPPVHWDPVRPKESWVAYILWFIFLPFGGHRFYLRRKETAIAQLVLTLTLFGILVSLPWAIVDLFLIPGMVREENAKLAADWDKRNRVYPVDDGGFIPGPGVVSHSGSPASAPTEWGREVRKR